MTHYKIRLQSPDGTRSISWDVERADDISALSSALEVCQQQKMEIWEGQRQIASIALSGTPRLTL
jgi:hypothetical protein